MISQYWSWLLASGGLLMLWLAGSGRRSAWILGLCVQVLWLSYGIVTRQWGFVVSSLAYSAVIGRNLAKWHAPTESDCADASG